MLAVVRCLKAWRHFLEGATEKFEIWTNHKNLKYFMKAQKLNQRQARWALYLSRFSFMLKHIKRGKRAVYYDKQVEEVVAILNCVLKGSWGEEESRGIRKKLKSRSATYL